jgi:acyl-CoA thioester hydrolase
VHAWPCRVYFDDTDAGGMAYHASHLRWAERARTESLRALGLPHQRMIEDHGAILVVRRIEVEYLRPARLDDSLRVETAVMRVTAARIQLAQTIRRAEGPAEGEDTLAALQVGLVCVARATLKPQPIPEPGRSALRGLLADGPA